MMYESLYKIVKTNNVNLSVCGYKYIKQNEDDKSCFENANLAFNNQNECVLSNKFDIISYYILSRDVAVWNKLYKKDLFKHMQYPIGKSYEDIYTTYRLLEKSEKIAILNKKIL